MRWGSICKPFNEVKEPKLAPGRVPLLSCVTVRGTGLLWSNTALEMVLALVSPFLFIRGVLPGLFL